MTLDPVPDGYVALDEALNRLAKTIPDEEADQELAKAIEEPAKRKNVRSARHWTKRNCAADREIRCAG